MEIHLSQMLAVYRIYARAEGKSHKTIAWITDGVRYFINFLGVDQEVTSIQAHDLRRFIIALQNSNRFRSHPFTKPQKDKLSPHTIKTYARAIRAFFRFLHREEFIEQNPMLKVKMPKVPKNIVPTFSYYYLLSSATIWDLCVFHRGT